MLGLEKVPGIHLRIAKQNLKVHILVKLVEDFVLNYFKK